MKALLRRAQNRQLNRKLPIRWILPCRNSRCHESNAPCNFYDTGSQDRPPTGRSHCSRQTLPPRLDGARACFVLALRQREAVENFPHKEVSLRGRQALGDHVKSIRRRNMVRELPIVSVSTTIWRSISPLCRKALDNALTKNQTKCLIARFRFLLIKFPLLRHRFGAVANRKGAATKEMEHTDTVDLMRNGIARQRGMAMPAFSRCAVGRRGARASANDAALRSLFSGKCGWARARARSLH